MATCLADESLLITQPTLVKKNRKDGGMTFVNITRNCLTRSRMPLFVKTKLGHEYIYQVTQTDSRTFKNQYSGEIEIIVSELNVTDAAVTPPFTIEDDTDGGDHLHV